jgi:hypothetical protein
MNQRYLALARDPGIIPGVQHYSDEWCDYCEVTSRCLGYRCTQEFRKQHGRRDGEPTFRSVEQAVAFTRELSAVEVIRTDELDALLSSPQGQSGVNTSDPLASQAWEYAVRVAFIMAPFVTEIAARTGRSPSGPDSEEVVLWYHLRIYMKVCRALVSRETLRTTDRTDEATGCVKLTLVSIERSRRALQALRSSWDSRDVDVLTSMLDSLEQGLNERFPDARAFLRIGLDCPAA